MSENSEKRSVKRLFVCNLPWDLDLDAFGRLVARFGTLESLRLPKDHLGRFRGLAFVQYARPADAKEALAELHGRVIDSRIIKAEFAVLGKQRERKPDQEISHSDVRPIKNEDVSVIFIDRPSGPLAPKWGPDRPKGRKKDTVRSVRPFEDR